MKQGCSIDHNLDSIFLRQATGRESSLGLTRSINVLPIGIGSIKTVLEKKKKQRTRSTGNRSFITFLLLLLLLLRYIALSFQRHLLDTNTNVLFFPLDSSLLRGIVPCLSSTMFSSSFLSVLFSKRRDVYRAFMRERLCLIVGD